MLTTSFRIRFALPTDAGALAELGARTFHDTFAADNAAEDMVAHLAATFSPERQRRELEDPHYACLVAQAGEALVAYALLHGAPPPPCVTGPAPIELLRFYVDRSCHGAGVARSLMDAVVAEALRRGARTLWLGVWERNARAIRFYEKCGFVDVGAQSFTLGRDVQQDRIMARPLAP